MVNQKNTYLFSVEVSPKEFFQTEVLPLIIPKTMTRKMKKFKYVKKYKDKSKHLLVSYSR